jgi:PhnB protein
MTQINAYLHFSGNCREAMTFYQKCLGGKLALQTVGESPMASQMPAEAHKSILHSSLTNGGFALMGSDMMGPEGVKKGNTVSLTLVCGSKEETETFFSRLSAGQVRDQLDAQLREAEGVKHRISAGDVVDVDIAPDTEPRTVTVPPDLTKALSHDVDARRIFHGLPYSHKQRYVLWIEGAKKAETRQGRLAKAIGMMKEGRS